MTDMEHGIFAGLFVASDEALSMWELAGLTPEAWPAVEFKRLETVKLGRLEAILTERSYEQTVADRRTELVATGGDAGPWIIRVADSLVDALAGLPPERVSDVAEAWTQTQELRRDAAGQLRPEEIVSLIDRVNRMSQLAAYARSSGLPMLLLMSL